MYNTPILFIIFNRPDSTRQVFEAIRKVKPSRLYIAADAPRKGNTGDAEKCSITRGITELIDWPCDVKRLYQDENLGCSQGPITAFKWFFTFEDEGIILEDDCLPSSSFFPFCAEMLEKYRNNKQIMLVSGCNLGYNLATGYSYGFSAVPNMWGWATWKRSEEMIDYKLAEWKSKKRKLIHVYKAFRQSLFDSDINWYKYWVDKFDRTVDQPVITWWDWQWIYYQTKNRMLSVFPGKNLIRNIGFDIDATHTKERDNPAANLTISELEFPLKHPPYIKADRVYEEDCLKWTLFYHRRLPWHFHIRHTIKMYLKNTFT